MRLQGCKDKNLSQRPVLVESESSTHILKKDNPYKTFVQLTMKTCPVCRNAFDENLSVCPYDGQPLDDTSLNSIVGTTLDGQYQIEALIGRGGMGAVYRATHLLLGEKVAIKILSPRLAKSNEYKSRFLREGQAARKVNHPNLVLMHDLRLTKDGMLYMVFEYIFGRTLEQELRDRGRLSAEEAMTVLSPIAEALQEAHTQGIVHRDLKPDNIMIGQKNGQAVYKLLDLGLAKPIEDMSNLTGAGQVLGTPYYMSPEQWAGTEVDPRADIYSLAAIFFETISGRKLFDGKSIPVLAQQHSSQPPPLLHETVREVTENFSLVINRALSKDRQKRQNSVLELIQQLRSSIPTNSVNLEDTLMQEDPSSVPTVFFGADDLNLGVSSDILSKKEITKNSSHNFSLTPEEKALLEKERATLAAGVINKDLDIEVDEKSIPTKSPDGEYRNGIKIPQKGLVIVIGGGVLLLLLLWLAWAQLFSTQSTVPKPQQKPTTTKTSQIQPKTTDKDELLRYWLDVNSDSSTMRVVQNVKLKSGESLKLNLLPQINGYVYIIASEPDYSSQTPFLDSKIHRANCSISNSIKAGQKFIFPKNQWLKFDTNPNKEVLKVVFSTKRLDFPNLLTKTEGEKLNEQESKELKEILAKSEKPSLEEKGDVVSVSLPKKEDKDYLTAFDIEIEHQD